MNKIDISKKKLNLYTRALFSKICLFIIIFLSISCFVFGRGTKEEEEIKTYNDEWILLITNFDSASLPDEKKPVSDVIMRKLVENITSINYRVRISEEYAYYEEYAWANNRSTAAKALAAKQNERSLLIYKGESGRAYKTNLAKFDNEIKELKEKLDEIDNAVPVINSFPVFKIKENNLSYQFPEPPKSGNEYRFCSNEKADAIITGSISDFHGRFIVSIKLYTVYTRSYVWEDRIIFSHEDIGGAMEEITRRLIINLSGSKPAAVTIAVQPEDALVLINRSVAEASHLLGDGELPIIEYPQGTITVTASARDHESISFSTPLFPGELSKIFINLKPIEYGNLEVTGAENESSGGIYLGALYAGDSPLTLRLPLNQMEFIEFKAEDERQGRIVFQMPDSEDFSDSFSIKTKKPPRKGSVDFSRRLFYWSWGATWVTGVTAWLSNHSFNNMVYAFNQSGSTSQKLYDDANRMFNIRNGAIIGLGVFAVIDIILITRYIYVSNKGAAQIRKSN